MQLFLGTERQLRTHRLLSVVSPVLRRVSQLSGWAVRLLAMDFKLELVAVPVSDVDRARDFYVEQAGFGLDIDQAVSDEVRFVQLTPPGSACSICIGKGLTSMAPGSLDGLQIVVADIHAARAELVSRGLTTVSEVDVQPWGSFVFFSDPDGNRWACSSCPTTPPPSVARATRTRAGPADVAGHGAGAKSTAGRRPATQSGHHQHDPDHDQHQSDPEPGQVAGH